MLLTLLISDAGCFIFGSRTMGFEVNLGDFEFYFRSKANIGVPKSQVKCSGGVKDGYLNGFSLKSAGNWFSVGYCTIVF